MKTNKVFAYLLIVFFAFFLFFNLESQAASKNSFQPKTPITWECNWMCETNNDVTCCYKYCSDDERFTWYQMEKFCFADPVTNLPQK
jgi:hypothetical protein